MVIKTYLAMQRPEQLQRGPKPSTPARLCEIDPCPVAEWRELYARIGGPWHWRERDAWSDERLAAHLDADDVRVFRVRADLPDAVGDAAGFLELVKHDDGSVEIAYIGLDPGVIGRGLGRWLLAEATVTAWSWGATHVWLHTCTLDADAALPNYLARGFQPTRTERYVTEIMRPAPREQREG